MNKLKTFFIMAYLGIGLSFCIADELPSGYSLIYKTDFQSGFDKRLSLQQPEENSMTIVDAPSHYGKALKVSIRRDADYSHVANGVPRAEINFGGRFRFQQGKEYFVMWSTYLPDDFVFDSKQPEGITQIHGGPNQGSPPWGITLTNNHYEMQLRNESSTQSFDLGSAEPNKGKWIQWQFHYKPDATGKESVSELSKDGKVVIEANGKSNALPNDDQSYLKIGIYKWWWKQKPTDVSDRTIYFSDVLVGLKN